MILLRRFLPVIAALVGLVVVWSVRPGVVENAAQSPVAWAVIVGTFLAGIGLRAASRRLGASPLVAQALGTGLIVGLVVALLAPSFQQRTLVEDLPDSLAAAGPTGDVAATGDIEGATVTADPSVTAFKGSAALRPGLAVRSRPSSTQPRQRPSQKPATQPTSQPTQQTTRQPTQPSTPQPTQQTQSSTEVDRSGPLNGIGHTASGTILLRTASGKAYVVFSDVNIEGTVDPSVHLVPDGSRTPSGGIRLGKLKAEKGTFSYELPASVDPTQRWSVLVWCDPYDTPIAAADPR